MNQEPAKPPKDEDSGSSPIGRGGAGTYIEGELGAYYLLQMLAGSEARGLPDALIERVQFQGVDEGYALDDLIVHAASKKGSSVLEIQSKRTTTFAPKDAIFISVCDQIARSAPDSPPTDRAPSGGRNPAHQFRDLRPVSGCTRLGALHDIRCSVLRPARTQRRCQPEDARFRPGVPDPPCRAWDSGR